MIAIEKRTRKSLHKDNFTGIITINKFEEIFSRANKEKDCAAEEDEGMT